MYLLWYPQYDGGFWVAAASGDDNLAAYILAETDPNIHSFRACFDGGRTEWYDEEVLVRYEDTAFNIEVGSKQIAI